MEQEMNLNVAEPVTEELQELEAMPELEQDKNQGDAKNQKVLLALEEMGLTADQCECCLAILQEAIQEKVSGLEKEMYDVKLNHAVDSALQKAGAIHLKAVKPFLENMESADFDADGGIVGLAEQVARLRMDPETKFLFRQQQPRMFKGVRVGEGSDEEEKRPNFLNMTYSDMMQYLEENPDAVI